MILEEICALVVSSIAKCIFQAPQLQRGEMREEIQEEVDEEDEGTHGREWEDTIHREYESTDENQFNDNDPSYASLRDESRVNRCLCQSFRKSLGANLGITFAASLLAVLAIVLVYFELLSSTLCYEWEHRSKNTIPLRVFKRRLILDQVEDVFLNLWFPATLVLLFGWMEFKKHYLSTFYIGCAFGATVTIYKCYLFIFNDHNTTKGDWMTHIGEGVFFVAIILSSILVARNFRLQSHSRSTYSYFHIITTITVQIFFGSVLAWIYRYVFNNAMR